MPIQNYPSVHIIKAGNPCRNFCPAAVHEMVQEKGQPRFEINASNCEHCKTCDIADPYEIITWVPPEGEAGRTTKECSW